MRPEYDRNGLSCFVDRSRGFLVVATPEEQVRQDTLDWLIDDLGIPLGLVRSEFHTAKRGGTGRADILVLAPGSTDHEGRTVLVVECKKPGVFLDDLARDQATAYANTVGAGYVVLTNGDELVPYAKEKARWRKLSKLPTWRQMLRSQGLRWSLESKHVPLQWKAIDTSAKCQALVNQGAPYDFVVGAGSPSYLASFALNLFECLSFDPGLTLPIEDGAIVIEKDLGARARWFGNSAGGTWASNYYRSLLVRDQTTGCNQVVSIAVIAGMKWENDPVFGNAPGMTYLCVAVDDGPRSHLSLELPLDRFLLESELKDGQGVLRHNGRMTAGKRGGVRHDIVLAFIGRTAPHLVDERGIMLGTLPSNRTISWNDAEDFLIRVVRYALVRDALRAELRASASPPPVKPAVTWKHGDIVKAKYDGKLYEPARYIRAHGKTRAVVHWYDDTFSSVRLADITGRSNQPWRLALEKPSVEFGSSLED